MNIADLGRQTSAGVIVGLGAAIYAVSYGALMFSGPLEKLVGFGITVAFIAAIGGALFGLISQERSFISGPDSNTISILATMLATVGSLGLPDVLALHLALETVFLTSIVCAATFYAVARLNLAGLIRYIPFSVMAGFLASTGWLMSSGALNIISGTPLTWDGLQRFAAEPIKPELAYGFCVAMVLQGLARRVSPALLIPSVMLTASLVVNVFLASGVCGSHLCSAEVWLFERLPQTQWLAPWELSWPANDAVTLLQGLPAMLVVAFVGLVTILLSIASLELNFEKEFDLNRMLKAHAASAAAISLLGGFSGLLSIARTTLNRHAGGGALSGVVAALMCFAFLLGAGDLIAYIPKAALGGLVLYLGISMMKQWLWDQRHSISRAELVQVLLILALVANYGFLVGFSAGILISCVIFVIAYSRIPLTSLATDLSLFASSVLRPHYQAELLKTHGGRIKLYRLSGYVFFGSANRIDALFQNLAFDTIDGLILDFTQVSGIDRSAIGVLQRIVRRYQNTPVRLYFVYSDANEKSLKVLAPPLSSALVVDYFSALDRAVEAAEDWLIERHEGEIVRPSAFEFLDSDDERDIFRGYCELKTVQTGELLCAEGDRSDEIFFLQDGSLDVVKAVSGREASRLAKLREGWVAGELAFYTGDPRTASIYAAAPSTVFILRTDALLRMRQGHPSLATRFDHMVIRKIAYSLARTSTLVSTLR